MFNSRHGNFIEVDRATGDDDNNACVFFCVPEGQRPAWWPARKPLPASGSRSGNPFLGNLAQRIRRDIETFDNQLEKYWAVEKLNTGDRSAAKLAELYRIGSGKKKPYSELVPLSKYRLDNNLKKVISWSEDNGDPSWATIGSEALRELIELYDDRESQRAQMGVAVNHLTRTAVELGWRDDNPMDKVRVPNPKLPERVFWTDEDVTRFQATATDLGYPEMAVLVDFLRATAQRYEDVLKMRHGFEYADGYIDFRQGKRDRKIISKVHKALLEKLDAMRVAGCDYLFANPETRTAYTSTQVQYRFNKIRSAMHRPGDTWITMQVLRHTCVVKLISEGMPPYKIAAMTGHKYQSIHQIMERYGIRTDNAAMDAARALHRANGGRDEDFGDYNPAEANFHPKVEPKKSTAIGLRRKRARQFLSSYLDRDELEDFFTHSPDRAVELAQQMGASL